MNHGSNGVLAPDDTLYLVLHGLLNSILRRFRVPPLETNRLITIDSRHLRHNAKYTPPPHLLFLIIRQLIFRLAFHETRSNL